MQDEPGDVLGVMLDAGRFKAIRALLNSDDFNNLIEWVLKPRLEEMAHNHIKDRAGGDVEAKGRYAELDDLIDLPRST